MICNTCENISPDFKPQCSTDGVISFSEADIGIRGSTHIPPGDSTDKAAACVITVSGFELHEYLIDVKPYGAAADVSGYVDNSFFYPPVSPLAALPSGIDRGAEIVFDVRGNATLLTSQSGSQPQLWDHNGSAMQLLSSEALRSFVYETPREGLANIGVARGTVLFEGSRNGNTYTGTAFVFSKGCGRAAFKARGVVSDDQRSVHLSGRAPIRSNNCNVTGQRDEHLYFELITPD